MPHFGEQDVEVKESGIQGCFLAQPVSEANSLTGREGFQSNQYVAFGIMTISWLFGLIGFVITEKPAVPASTTTGDESERCLGIR